eukprot:NODE_3930_length_1259_cov_47.803697_g3448_i0.p1 GENE.NODE_3930_length_1259_cov_47.803697_g3448_i0~~NODE_3930_length_1259_cov_47.803697_g3448_i0.p1  ORF type:complete len:346 (-),score=70.23 NODE_3930_length_1259_cov_47.803697_g3448_i0:221-1192(-)
MKEKYPVPHTEGPSNRRLLREERLPPWLKRELPGGEGQGNYIRIKKQLKGKKIATICQEGRCPNIGECWGGGSEHTATATIMLLGDTCTRACRFCSVTTHPKPPDADPEEPLRVAESVAAWGVDYIVLTMVNRDDMEDGGARHVVDTVQNIKKVTKGKMLVECLVGDFDGKEGCVELVARSGLDVFAHNMETVERLTPRVRDRRAKYKQSLTVLERAKKEVPSLITKSSVMLGLGETEEDIQQVMRDLRSSGVDCLTFGQYLQADKSRMKVSRYVPPEEFDQWRIEGEKMGFLYVASGPFVRSSYKAGEYFLKNVIKAREKST